MNPRKKQRLEGLLRAVKEIKSNFYIGTSEAYHVIKEIGRTYDNPEKISIRLNHFLRQKFEKPSY